MEGSSNAGGFIPPLSPPASVASQPTRILPEPRHSVLKRGSQKETQLFTYLDRTLDKIDGKVERQFEAIGGTNSTSAATGYSTLNEVVRDLDETVNVIWVSGTPSIQIPFLLSLSGKLIDYLGRFDFTPRKLLRLLNKLDLIFSSLLTGIDSESKQPLANINSLTLNVTEKVRLRSIVESTRVAVVNAYRKAQSMARAEEGFVIGETDNEGTATEIETENDDAIRRFFDEGESDEDWEMEMGKVYERTIEILGSLDTGPISNYSDTGARPFAY